MFGIQRIQEKTGRMEQRATDFFHHFGSFVFKQNILALALAVIIGNATNNVVQALIRDMFMPVINLVVKDQSWVTWGVTIGTVRVANVDGNGNQIYVDAAGVVIPLNANGRPTKSGGLKQTHEMPNKILVGDLIWQFTNLVLIGIIAFMMTRYLLQQRPPPAAPPAPPGPAMRVCPFCLESVMMGAKVCKFCTRDLPVEGEASSKEQVARS